MCWGGGLRPASTTVEIKPASRRAMARRRCSFVFGMDVMARRALEAFVMEEQTWARLTRDIVTAFGYSFFLFSFW